MTTLKADFHMHTNASDGKSTVEEIAELVIERDYGIIAVTDHNAIKGSLGLLNFQEKHNLDLIVLPAVEVFFRDKSYLSELTAYFEDPGNLERFYVKHIEPNKSSFPTHHITYRMNEVINAIHEYEGIFGIPHGYTKKGVLRRHGLSEINGVRIIEASNGTSSREANQKSEELYNNLRKSNIIFVSCSDYHSMPACMDHHTLISGDGIITKKRLFENLKGLSNDLTFKPIIGKGYTQNDRLKHHFYSVSSYFKNKLIHRTG